MRTGTGAARHTRTRTETLGDHDDSLRDAGHPQLAGVDEVGAGCIAGPVMAAAVVLPRGWRCPGIDDSKALSPAARERLEPRILAAALAVAITRVEAPEIDRINILRARLLAMGRAIRELSPAPSMVLVDGNLELPGLELPQRPIVGGDHTSLAIAAASIVAKVARDRWMAGQAARFPGYGFERHKGYPSPEHKEALARLGPCPLHRRTFAPVSELLAVDREGLPRGR